jgi:uncharacterized membrane protein YhhN
MPGLALPLLIASMDWLALRQGWRRLDYLAKPGVIVTLLILVWQAAPDAWTRPPLVWVVLGLGFSLVGDVLLMLPAEKFLGALAAFLAAHLAYTLGFSFGRLTPDPLMLVPALSLLLILVPFHRKLQAALAAAGRTKLRTPVTLYTLAITGMTLSAMWTFFRSSWVPPGPLLVSLGGLLFLLSDALLAWNRFVHPIRDGQIKVRISYHLGQFFLVIATTWPFLAF